MKHIILVFMQRYHKPLRVCCNIYYLCDSSEQVLLVGGIRVRPEDTQGTSADPRDIEYYESVLQVRTIPSLFPLYFSLSLSLLLHPVGIIDSAEVQLNGNLNEWVRTDMNVC